MSYRGLGVDGRAGCKSHPIALSHISEKSLLKSFFILYCVMKKFGSSLDDVTCDFSVTCFY